MAYDIFISYRRKGAGAGVAGELQAKLENRGYKVFLDVDNIGSGAFPEQINQAIKDCKDFLLILSPGMMDRCVDEEDWVRHEIVLAEQYGKNVVGVSLPGFVMPQPETLPLPLRDIPEKQVFLWSHEYRNASFEKIVENLVSTQQKKKKLHRNLAVIAVAVVVAVVCVSMLYLGGNLKEVSDDNTELALKKAINDTFMSFVNRGDSLLRLVPNPMEKTEFQTFMNGIGAYDMALQYQKANAGYVSDSIRLIQRYDSLMQLRSEWLQRELDATVKFLDVDQVDFARFRYENAEALAMEDDRQMLEAIGQRIPD